ncbi:hypothetical protein GCM10027033_14890 [Leucobacter ruminantium]
MQRIGQALGFSSDIRSPWAEDGILEEVTAAALYGDVSMIPVSASRALRLAVLAKGRRQLVGPLARLPLVAFDSSGARHKNQPNIIVQPDPSVPRSNTIGWIATELYLYPCAYTLVTERNSYGFPHRLTPVPHGDAETDDKGQLIAVKGKPVNPADTLRFDGLDGGLLAEASDTIRRALVLNRVAALAEENPVPAVELHNEGTTITDEQIDKLIERYRAARRKHGVAYTSKEVKLQVHGTQPENLLIDGRKRIDLELARHANLPAWAADIPLEGASLTYQNRHSKNQELIDQFLSSYTTVIEERLSMDDVTPHGTTVKFQFDELTKPDMKTRFDTYALGKQHGFVTNQQIADWEGWETAAPETPTQQKEQQQ